MGSIIPGIGTALGAAIGAAVGGLSGGLQIYEKKDDAFKSYVEDAYETVTGEQSSSLTSGSSIAGSREQTRMAFAQRMGEEEADAYLGVSRPWPPAPTTAMTRSPATVSCC